MRIKQGCVKFSLLVFMLFLFYSNALAGFVFHDFEDVSVATPWSDANTVGEISNEVVHSGSTSWKISSASPMNSIFIPSIKEPSREVNFTKYPNDRLTFWIYALADDGDDHYVELRLYDHGDYRDLGCELMTTQKTKHGEWKKLTVYFRDLYSNFDLTRVDKLEIKNEVPGVYYIDDIQVVRDDWTYQSFDDLPLENCASTVGGNCSIHLSTEGEPVHEGIHSLKLSVDEVGNGISILNENYKYIYSQYWVDGLNPQLNDRLEFEVFPVSDSEEERELGKNLEVEFYDQGTYRVNPVKIKLPSIIKNNEWSKVSVPFSKLPSDFDFDHIDKIQVLFKWPGIYYIDSFKAARFSVTPFLYRDGPMDFLKWNYVPEVGGLILEERVDGGEWKFLDVYENFENSVLESPITSVKKREFRMLCGEDFGVANDIPYEWDFSPVVTYTPQPIEIEKSKLIEGQLSYSVIYDSDINYEVEVSYFKNGPEWEAFDPSHLSNDRTRWFRVRATKDVGGVLETGDWSQPVSNQADFLKAVGTRIVDATGNEVTLRGVNLGGVFALDYDVSRLGNDTTLRDEYSIREELRKTGDEDLLEIFQGSFINGIDYDFLKSIGVNLIRLPVYYRQFLDEYGNWIADDKSFFVLDWVIEECARHNMYVLLDLHGAPGGQSNLAHCGREGDLYSNMLFLFTQHQNDTVDLWTKIADRYKNNTAVMGYDLLNEPIGYERANQGFGPLWTLYARLYEAIRSVDENHIIVFEGAPGWDTLPNPETYSWVNVIYQFQWFPKLNDEYATAKSFDYDMDEMLAEHKLQLDNHLDNLEVFQREYNIPVMVGAFNCFESRESWDYYLNQFNNHSLSWTLWTYKSNSEAPYWGFFNLSNGHEEGRFPDFENDSPQVIEEKLDTFNSSEYFHKNEALIDTVTPFLGTSSKPFLVASYSFDEMEGGMVPDISGNGYDAELHSGPTISDDAVAGKSMNFVRGDFLQTNKGNPLAGAETFTVSLWFKTHLEEPEGTLPNIKFLSSAEWHIGANATGWNVGLHYPEGWADHQQGSIHYNDDPWDRSDTGVYPKSDEWNNLVIVYDGARVKEYLNGVISVDHAGSGRPLGLGRDYMQIGTWGGSFYMEGLMDEIQIYRGALSKNEIEDIYKEYERGLPKEPVLVTHYNFDEIVSNQVLDVSGNGYDADIFGNPSLVYDSVQEMAMEFNHGDYLRANKGNPLDGAETFTVSLWFKSDIGDPDGLWPDMKFLSSADFRGGKRSTGWYVGLYFSHGWADNEEGSIQGPGTAWDRSILAQYPLSNEWNHLAVVYDGVRIKEYYNGELSIDIPGSGVALGVGQPFMDIGQWMNSFNMVGLMDEVKIFRTALVESQVKELYDVINIPKNLCVGHWGTAYGAGQFKARTYDRSPSPRNLPRLAVSKGDLFEFDFTLHHGSNVRFEFVEGFYANQQPYSPVFRKTFENVEGRNTVQILMDRDFDLDRIAAHVYVGDNPLTSNIDVHSVRRIATGIPFAQIEPLGGLEMVDGTITLEMTQQEGMWIELDGSSSHVTQEGNIIESYIWSSPSFEGDINGSTLLTRLGLGTHVISLKVFDGVSYSFTKEVTIDVVDTVAPSLTILTPKQRSYRTKYVYLDVKTRIADASGACQLKYTLNDNELQSNRIDLASNIGENNVLEVTATDSAGNSTTKNVTFKIR